MIKPSHLAHDKSKIDQILSQRQLTNVIDACPHIIREDKHYLRNKIKNFYKSCLLGQFNQYNPPKQISQLFYIFKQCHKPLNKIHLFQNHYHWLQVKLRKYVANQKKNNKDFIFNSFNKFQYFNHLKKGNNQSTPQQDQQQYDKSKNSSHQLKKLQSSSQKTPQSKLNQTSKKNYQLKTLQNNPKISEIKNQHNIKTYTHRQKLLPYKNNRSLSKDNNNNRKQKTITQIPQYNDQNNHLGKSLNIKITLPSPRSYRVYQKNDDYGKYIQRVNHYQNPFPPKYQNFQIYRQNCHNKCTNCVNNSNLSNSTQKSHHEDQTNYNCPPPTQYQQKRDSCFTTQRLSSRQQVRPVNKFDPLSQNSHQQSLFTPPHILQQCRRFIRHSEGQQKIDYPFQQSQENTQRQSFKKIFQINQNNLIKLRQNSTSIPY